MGASTEKKFNSSKKVVENIGNKKQFNKIKKKTIYFN